MDIASLSMNLATSQIQNSVSISVLSKSLDTMEALGDGLVQIIDAAAMERSVNPHIGGNIDITVWHNKTQKCSTDTLKFHFTFDRYKQT